MAESEIDEAIGRIADQNRPFLPQGEGAEAKLGDKVTIAFSGTIDGEAFEGGTGDDVPVVIGSQSFIPGFEEQLVGIKAGESAHRQGAVPGELSRRPSLPARTPSST